ncbi:uncharacterized protein LOC124125236 isoform X1 [Haliotis rufescens]|uniref:uncharacterized protein LOC124125236 isoform X1 n=1 Tax=Haliotis rufescens TaxID=6454 RepID=UPI001EB0830A|nr:uncharacterized protein LOC124125236 isoform X1 [Haliotis rufescens]
MSGATPTTGTCRACFSVEKKYKERSGDPNFFLLHAERDVITAPKSDKEKKKRKKLLQDQLEKRVAALRNTVGGVVIVHLHGQASTDRYLEYFDEFIGNPFSELLEDGRLFVETYVRHWLSTLPGFEDFYDFVHINVCKTAGVATVDFCTKTCNDFEKKNPSVLNILSILSRTFYTKVHQPQIRGIPLPAEVDSLHENRAIELKTFMNPEAEKDVVQFVDHVWFDLKLRENLTSLTKVEHGGSFYVGITEEKNKDTTYKTKTPKILGFHVSFPHENITEHIQQKIAEHVTVLQLNGLFEDAPSDLINIAFHEVRDSHPRKFVLEIAVRHFDGIVFYDKEGPRTYLIDHGNIVRMTRMEWLHRVRCRLPPWII